MIFVDFISYNSEFTRRTAIDHYAIKQKRDSVIYNGLAVGIMFGNRRNLPSETLTSLRGKFVISGFERFVRTKRFDRLVAGFARFQENTDETILLLLGDGRLKNSQDDVVSDVDDFSCDVSISATGGVRNPRTRSRNANAMLNASTCATPKPRFSTPTMRSRKGWRAKEHAG